MLSIPPEVPDFGDEEEKNCEADKIKKKENINEFWIITADQKSENTNHTSKIRQVNPAQILSKEEQEEGSKRCTFSMVKSL